MSTASLNGAIISRASVQIPAWGVWWADVELVDAIEFSGAVSLVVGDATLSGTIVSGGAFDGKAGYRIAGGAGGWGKTVDSQGYQNDAGVKASTVASDLAQAVGETIAGAPSKRVGPNYARCECMASIALHSLFPRGWYVDLAGVTQVGSWPSTTYSGKDPRVRVDPAVGVVEIATEDVAALVPGVSVDGYPAAVDVEWSVEPGRVTARVYSGRRPSRRLDAFARLIELLDPRRRYRGCYEYRVGGQDPPYGRLNLQAVRAASGMPDLAHVPLRPSPGINAMVTLGSTCVVAFLDGDPGRPAVIAAEDTTAPGWSPSMLFLGNTPALQGVARMGDPVTVAGVVGAITGPCSLKVFCG